MKRNDERVLESFAIAPAASEQFEAWLQQSAVTAFLEQEMRDDRILVYVSFDHFFLHAVFVPRFDLRDENSIADLQEWSLSADATWGICVGTQDVSVCGPMNYSRSALIESGEKLVFSRYFDGNKEGSPYLEINQKICHVLDLHHLPERKAWCCLDCDGEISEAIKIHSLPTSLKGHVVTMDVKKLATYAAATGQLLVRMFDVTRFRPGTFHGWPDMGERRRVDSLSVHGYVSIHPGVGSYSRGVQVVTTATTKADLINETFSSEDDGKQYESFIAMDWRNGVIGEFSCDPTKLANYFVPIDGPFQTTPAFFRPEVLSKYKADPEKYTLDHGSISCRSTWYLQSWDVNEAGQVFTYLCYLGDLPHKEQLHWKQFNEQPKAGLPEGTVKTDFMGQWDTSYEPLRCLLQRCRALSSEQRSWWKIRDESLLSRTHYPHTDSRADWANEILNLDQLLIESLEETRIRRRAAELGAKTDARMRALKLIEACLVADGFEDDHARKLMGPFHDVHELRSQLKGHASGETAKKHEASARRKHSTLVDHFRHLCKECDESLEIVSSTLGE